MFAYMLIYVVYCLYSCICNCFFQSQTVNLQYIFISPTMPCPAASTTTPKKTFLYLRIFESHIIRWENSWFITQRSCPPVTIFLCHQDQVTLLEREVPLLRALVGVHGNVLCKREMKHKERNQYKLEHSWGTPRDPLPNLSNVRAGQEENFYLLVIETSIFNE